MDDVATPALCALWAKLARAPSAPVRLHPLVCHLLDVAAVAAALWERALSPRARAWFAEALGLDEDVAGRWIAFLTGAHDLGKASPGFQLQDDAPPIIKEMLHTHGLRCEAILPNPPPHGLVTAEALPRFLTSEFAVPSPVARQMGIVVGGHHGVFPRTDDLNALTPQATGSHPWVEVRNALAQVLARAVELPHTAGPQQLSRAAALGLAGLVSVADWIGSVEEHFPYAVSDSASPVVPGLLTTYPDRAREQAALALDRLGWMELPVPCALGSFAALFPWIPFPRPLQDAAVRLAERLAPPFLVVLEAPTGEGKTEAAMYLADHAVTVHRQQGLYFALPTQATSNQMFSRVRAFLDRRYPGRLVNLQLLHGHAALSAEFELLRQHADALLQPSGVAQDSGADSELASVVAAEWFTHRKRGLLAPFGVGTVDQALLAVLQTRHGFVRLWGLANKVVIVDEVHAYDAYMTSLLERLLEWLAALGTSVVLLSATLPSSRQRQLLDAYARGLGRTAPELSLPAYPRLAWVTRNAAGGESFQAAPSSVRTVRIDWVDGTVPDDPKAPYPLGERLRETLAGGGCAVVVCNTVARAQQVYRRLRPYFGKVGDDDRFVPELADDGEPVLDLFHARFLFQERDRREKRALVRFGKEGDVVTVAPGEERLVRRPDRAVLVATQVVEQSLDLDFDLMVTDLAPVDLILQRIGRLHRHERERPAALAMPTVWICRPEEDRDGVPRFGQGDERVYAPHVLLRSWLALRDRAAIGVPADVEALIEAVYDDRACPSDLPEAVRRRWEETWRQRQDAIEDEQREAQVRWISRPSVGAPLWRFTENPREDDSPDTHPAHQALTRLSEQTVSVVCLYGSSEQPTFDRNARDPVPGGIPDLALIRRLLERSVALSDRRIIHALLSQQPPDAWQKSPLLRHHRLLVLDSEDRASIGAYWLELHPELGVVVHAARKEATQ